MPDIHIQREHGLGLPQARCIAHQWITQAETDYGMACAQDEQGLPSEGLERWCFSRSGVSGTLTVAADRFELQMKLGFLLGAFKGRIESEIQSNLDRLLAADAMGKSSA